MDKFEPTIVAFCCHFCAYTAADLAGTMRLQYPPNVRIVRLPCTGKVDVRFLLEAFEKGADGVYVAGCLEGDCHFLTGNFRAKKRVAYAKRILDEIGIRRGPPGDVQHVRGHGPAFCRGRPGDDRKNPQTGTQPHKEIRKGHGAWGRGEEEKTKKPDPAPQEKSIGAKGP